LPFVKKTAGIAPAVLKVKKYDLTTDVLSAFCPLLSSAKLLPLRMIAEAETVRFPS
jgi:hypothetical protein